MDAFTKHDDDIMEQAARIREQLYGFLFDADCPACLRHVTHTIQQHEAELKRSLEVEDLT